jgi:hypothetical protein
VHLTQCSAPGCGAVSHGEQRVTYRRDGSQRHGSSSGGGGSGGGDLHAGEHVCVGCELPFCIDHFAVGKGVSEEDLEDAPERDGMCLECSLK